MYMQQTLYSLIACSHFYLVAQNTDVAIVYASTEATATAAMLLFIMLQWAESPKAYGSRRVCESVHLSVCISPSCNVICTDFNHLYQEYIKAYNVLLLPVCYQCSMFLPPTKYIQASANATEKYRNDVLIVDTCIQDNFSYPN